MEVKLNSLKREVIKPASPAPQDHLQLSYFDYSHPGSYVSTIFFYKLEETLNSREIISQNLKTSLSNTLSRFYPLTGRIHGVSIICNNEGALFTEAQTNLNLSDFLKNLHCYSLQEFLPSVESGESSEDWPLLSAKVSFFGSGSGFAITVSISHHICDATSILTFVNEWAATSKGEVNEESVHFAEASIYPPAKLSFPDPSADDHFDIRSKCVTNRFVFESSKIIELKRKAASEKVPNPSRVEAISSLIWKCATNASRSNLIGAPRVSLMGQVMDLRPRIPYLSQDAIGNLQSAFFLKKDPESEMKIDEIVTEFRNAKEKVNEMIKQNLGEDSDVRLGEKLVIEIDNFVKELKPDIDRFMMSSWVRKRFYDVDFGWENPVWIGYASHEIYHNEVFVVLIDSKDGESVEAWVGLPEQDMVSFVRDQDLLAYAVLNPPVII